MDVAGERKWVKRWRSAGSKAIFGGFGKPPSAFSFLMINLSFSVTCLARDQAKKQKKKLNKGEGYFRKKKKLIFWLQKESHILY